MKQHNLLYASSYDRGLEILLQLWPKVKAKYPDAQLHIAYGWDLFDNVTHDNPERQAWKQKMVEMMRQDGVTDHGRLGKDELEKLRKVCGIWAYPSIFEEINCITALESQNAGLVPVVFGLAALNETVQSGHVIPASENGKYDATIYLEKLIHAMSDREWYTKESKKAIAFAKKYTWYNTANQWIEVFKKKSDFEPLITVYTPTVRKGFWNSMAQNLSIQTYKNFEWVIVDDYEEDRHELAMEIAKKYNLNIRYIWNKKKLRRVERKYRLVMANNTMLSIVESDLIVFLQDFIYMPPDGLEQFVTIYKKHPNTLIASVDVFYTPKTKPNTESEDWFNGSLDIFGTYIRSNSRIKNLPLRETENPFDFEQNYGAIPTKIAQELNGWWEFYDEGLGYDNTDIAYRALASGYKILIDETNVAVCLDHWKALKNNKEQVLGRARRLNDPRYLFMVEMVKQGKLPLVRDTKIEDQIQLLYDIPDDIKDDDVVRWVNVNGTFLVQQWLEFYKNL